MIRKFTEENYGKYSMLLLIAKYVLLTALENSPVKTQEKKVIVAY